MTKSEHESFQLWIKCGNAFQIRNGVWVEQTTQYDKEFTFEELKKFFIKEYLTQ